MSNPTNRQTATRFAIIAALVLAMSIPLALVNGVADERQGFFDQTLADISATWGGSQQIAGPFLIIPEAHKPQLDIEDGQVVSRAQRTYQIVLPTQLELDIKIDHEMRHRAIYEVPVYRAHLQAKGRFDAVNTILQSRSGTTLLFVSLTFLSFVCFELTQAIRFHPIQYGVVGLGLVLFYLAVLSLSEHMEFRLAYLSATILLTALIASYVWAMTRRRVLAVCSGSTVVILYATLYVLLQLESFALLTGTALLFGGLIALMYVTRSLTERILLNEPDDPSFNQPPGLNA